MLDITAKKDTTLETEGVWVTIAETPSGYVWWLPSDPRPVGDGVPTARLKVARSGNRNARNYRQKALQPYKRFLRQNGELSEEARAKVMNEVIAHAILLDWDDIKVGGKKVKYTPELGLQVLSDNEDFQLLVIEISATTQIYRDEAIEADAETLGNS